MLNLAKVAATVARQGTRQLHQERLTVLPPKNRISAAEKAAHGLVLVASVVAIPGWVLVHMEDYKKKE